MFKNSVNYCISCLGSDDTVDTGSYTGIVNKVCVVIPGFVMHINFKIVCGSVVGIRGILQNHGVSLTCCLNTLFNFVFHTSSEVYDCDQSDNSTDEKER